MGIRGIMRDNMIHPVTLRYNSIHLALPLLPLSHRPIAAHSPLGRLINWVAAACPPMEVPPSQHVEG